MIGSTHKAGNTAVERALRFVEGVDGRYWATIFFLGLFGYTLAMLLEALTYSNVAALFPLVIGVPLLVGIVVQVVLLLFPERVGIRSADLFESVQQLDTEEKEEVATTVQYRRELETILWTALVVLLIWLFGHLIGLALFVSTFIYVHERSLTRAIGVTAITFVFTLLLFKVLLGASLWQGITGLGVVFS